jgi:hypothetical protein
VQQLNGPILWQPGMWKPKKNVYGWDKHTNTLSVVPFLNFDVPLILFRHQMGGSTCHHRLFRGQGNRSQRKRHCTNNDKFPSCVSLLIPALLYRRLETFLAFLRTGKSSLGLRTIVSSYPYVVPVHGIPMHCLILDTLGRVIRRTLCPLHIRGDAQSQRQAIFRFDRCERDHSDSDTS